MKKVILLITLSLTSCSTAQLHKEWAKRGYSEEDKNLIKEHLRNYNSQLAASRSSFFMVNTQNSQVEQQLRNVFCNCVKKLGDKCREKPDSLNEQEKQLWAKSNAAEMALKAQHGGDLVATMGNLGAVDPDQCN